ncbi:MAG: nodulation protein NfeD [Bacteroidetes bacterium]|nr:MAG: nodulation protein NfeD [Bacteroidota bacterium]
MNKIIFLLAIMFLSNFSFAESSNDTTKQETKKTIVFQYDIMQQIAPAVWRHTKQSFEQANAINADLILIHMNTYGGLVDMADSIRTEILNSKIPVYVFIDNNAASAGALISIACNKIYMRKGANIGAATVVNQTGAAMPDKYQSYMRSTMRSTAEAHGKDTIINGNDTIYKWKRDPLIAEAMVDPRTYIKGIIDTGKVLTLTTNEAIKYGYCEGKAETISGVLKLAKIDNYEIKKFKITTLESIIDLLVNPAVHGLLIMLIIGGIYFELQTPGIGFPLAIAVLAAVLYFAPLYLEGLAANWEILLFIIGLILLALEIFVIPGFGVAGVSGIILIVVGLSLSMVDNIVFELGGNYLDSFFKSLVIVVSSMFFGIIASVYFSKKLFDTGYFSFLALNSTQKLEDGYVAVDNTGKALIGKQGIASTILRPSGKVKIDNDTYDAKAQYGYILKNDKIEVVKHEAGQLYVKKID